jgi:L-lactate dehydrogenase complex protein LldG
MNNSKKIILDRIRKALQDVPDNNTSKDNQIPRSYRQTTKSDTYENLRLFADRVADYKASVQIITASVIKNKVFEACKNQNVQKLVIPPGLPKQWYPDDVDLLFDGPEQLSYDQLDHSDGVLTGCALSIAQTGTIVLDGGDAQGRRALTLLPDYHLCVVFEHQIVGIVTEAFKKLEDNIKKSGPPVTFISGPSATSDIELNRVEGVHGPRKLEVLLITEE